ncbi:MAG: tributyrin esterase [Methanotrichaceae archaeon]
MSYRDLVDALKRGDTILIRGDAGGRLGSSLGVDLVKFGGDGGQIEGTGSIVVDGNVGKRLGISMLRGTIYVSGLVEPPLGNVVEVETDRTGYRKFVSITEVLEQEGPVLQPNFFDEEGLVLKDDLIRDTLAARNAINKTVRVEGDAGMSAGILMHSGFLDICGDAGRNTGVLMRGGRLAIQGSCDDFTAIEMKSGEIFVQGDAGNYICAKMKGGVVYAQKGTPVPPAKVQTLKGDEASLVTRVLGTNNLQAMMYKKFGL